jgi:hypothetical protein
MRVATLFLVLCTAVAASAQDLTITSKGTTDGGAPQTAMSYISSDHLRVEDPHGTTIIFDLASGNMTIVNTKQKTYFVATQKDFDDLSARMKALMNSPEMKKAQEQMKNLPPDVKKKMEGMGGAFTVDVRKLGTSRTVAGYHCENWSMSIGQMSRTEECVTTDLKFPQQTWDRFQHLNASLMSAMSSMGPGGSFEKMRDELSKIKGIPIATTTTMTVMGKTSVAKSEVTSIQRGPIAASVWQVPAGYKKIANPMSEAMQPRKH